MTIDSILKSGGIGVLATDTIYGVVGTALNRKTVERVYRVRRRNPKKPLIILIGSVDDLKLFHIPLTAARKKILRRLWPGKVSVILPCARKKFAYLHRGTKTLAFRLPAKKDLRALLAATGPLVAPSANWEGHPPALTIAKARKYFGGKVDFYANAGTTRSLPSTLVALRNGRLAVLRQGAVKIDKSGIF
ncbi:MAG: threonylcarbamoyl-AMP synthase [Patescibacteria group bacterium]|nr:threonylcarbamoyl-AMP synthase [Patescibacteria group bacterium]